MFDIQAILSKFWYLMFLHFNLTPIIIIILIIRIPNPAGYTNLAFHLYDG